MTYIGAVIQARMSSERLPGKSLRHLVGKPLLEYVLDRVTRATMVQSVIIATSEAVSDDPIYDYCEANGVSCYRGKLAQVADRFGGLLEVFPLDVFVRISGDSPLLDPALIDQAVNLMCQHPQPVDLVTNVMPRSFPPGQSVEAVRTSTFLSTLPSIRDAADQEHVTRYFYTNAKRFSIMNFGAREDYAGVQLTVDTEADYQRLSRMIALMDRPHWEYSLSEVVTLYREVARA